MKKIFPILCLVILPLFMSSCEEQLKLYPPDGLIKDQYWKTKEDAEAVLMAAYSGFAQIDARLFYYGEIRADMLVANTSLNAQLRNIMNSNIYPSNPFASWNLFYSIINNCNLVIKYSPEVKRIDPTLSTFKFQSMNAEAVFLRSLAYFYLVRIWNDVPFIHNAYDSDSQDLFPVKTDSDVILDSLEIQLNRILLTIPKDHETNARTRGRATNAAVNALLADIALWRFKYQDCIDYVENIENNELYDLLPGGRWFTIFSEGNTLEGIFEIQFDGSLGQNNSMYAVTQPLNRNFMASLYAMDVLSPEISREIVRGNGSLRSQDRLIWKYIGQNPDGVIFRSGNNLRSANWIVYRLADVLLMKAEALSQLGFYDEAISIVNTLRVRAFVEPFGTYPQNPIAFEDLILEERAKELAYEGKRWFDLLRMGRRNSYQRKNKLIEIITENVPATQKRVLASKLSDPNGWYMPIHNSEIENNLNLIQNPFYQIYD